MVRARGYFLLGAAAWLAACAETTGPPVPQSPLIRADGQLHHPDGKLHHLKWQRTARRREFAVIRNGATLAAPQSAASALSFWAFPSRDQAIQINYLAWDGTWQPYLWFSVPKGGLARWPDGTRIARTDSVLITVSIDTVSLVVHFEPTGLAFNPRAPAQLTVWYTGASPDFDASGTVDAADGYIEQNLLGMWVQEFAGDPWNTVVVVQSVPDKMFIGSLNHFSGYAVSW